MSLDAEFVALLRCPKCRGALLHPKTPDGFACVACALFFAVDDDLPNFLVEEAKSWPLSAPSAAR
jgi:uncharacterized protein YbaR (Trm112 family)